ncbi:MAG: hypothetical protein ABI686_07015 [Acidobacteriota bacterium]
MNKARYFITGTHGSYKARYCYSVFLRHLVMAKQNGLPATPRIIAELGPGESIGSGLAALLSGAERYFAFDVIEHANLEHNLEIFDELVELFKRKEPIPGELEFPEAKPKLESYEFPSEILTDELLSASLEPTRLNQIRKSIVNYKTKDSLINYVAPWDDAQLLDKESVDMIFSQAVMEHVVNLAFTYKAFSEWLKPDGFMSHQIDFKCHGTAEEWNGHWTYSDLTWKLIQGSRPYLLNREPHSTHLKLLRENNFKIVCDEVFELPSKLSKKDLSKRHNALSDEDLTASSAFVQSVKISR